MASVFLLFGLAAAKNKEQSALDLQSLDLQTDDSVFPVTEGGAAVGWGCRKDRCATGFNNKHYGHLHEKHATKESLMAYS